MKVLVSFDRLRTKQTRYQLSAARIIYGQPRLKQ